MKMLSRCIECQKALSVRRDHDDQILGYWCLNQLCYLGRKNAAQR